MKTEYGSVMDRELGMGVGSLGRCGWILFLLGSFRHVCMYFFFWFSIYMNVVFDICFHMFSYVYLRCV